jgi:hypothetical protein
MRAEWLEQERRKLLAERQPGHVGELARLLRYTPGKLSVRVGRNAFGSWDILLNIDGGYAWEHDADRAAEEWAQALSDALMADGGQRIVVLGGRQS